MLAWRFYLPRIAKLRRGHDRFPVRCVGRTKKKNISTTTTRCYPTQTHSLRSAVVASKRRRINGGYILPGFAARTGNERFPKTSDVRGSGGLEGGGGVLAGCVPLFFSVGSLTRHPFQDEAPFLSCRLVIEHASLSRRRAVPTFANLTNGHSE